MELLIACFDDDIKAEGLHFSLLRGARESADLPQKMEDSVIAVLIQQKVLAEQKQIYGSGFKALLTRLFHI